MIEISLDAVVGVGVGVMGTSSGATLPTEPMVVRAGTPGPRVVVGVSLWTSLLAAAVALLEEEVETDPEESRSPERNSCRPIVVPQGTKLL